jgi:hypothetical protein
MTGGVLLSSYSLNALDTVVAIFLLSLGVYLLYKLFGVCSFIVFNLLRISFFLLLAGLILAFFLQMDFASPVRQELRTQYRRSVITPPVVGMLVHTAEKTTEFINLIFNKFG